MYANRNDMINRYTETEVDQLESMHEVGNLAMQNSLVDATEQINSYLSSRYDVPVQNSEYLKSIACDIARYKLYVFSATEEVKARYKEAIDWLKDVSKGNANVTFAVKIGDAQQNMVIVKNSKPVGFSGQGAVFNDDVFNKMPKL